MKDGKKYLQVLSRIGVILLLACSAGWIYWQAALNYQIAQDANNISQTLLAKYSVIVRAKDTEISLVKENLVQAESLLDKLRLENDKLREKIRLLDTVAGLESTIARLKEKNVLLINHIGSLKTVDANLRAEVKTVKDGRSLLKKYRDNIRAVKKRLKEIAQQHRQARIDSQKEQDRVESMLGNNGYLVRDGKLLSGVKTGESAVQSIKVDVKFVK